MGGGKGGGESWIAPLATIGGIAAAPFTGGASLLAPAAAGAWLGSNQKGGMGAVANGILGGLGGAALGGLGAVGTGLMGADQLPVVGSLFSPDVAGSALTQTGSGVFNNAALAGGNTSGLSQAAANAINPFGGAAPLPADHLGAAALTSGIDPTSTAANIAAGGEIMPSASEALKKGFGAYKNMDAMAQMLAPPEQPQMPTTYQPQQQLMMPDMKGTSYATW